MTSAQLVLQPRGGVKDRGPANFDRSVRQGISLADHELALGPDFATLARLFPDGIARLWGSTPPSIDSNPKAKALRDRRAGDKVLFYADKTFIAEATILHTFHNYDAAKSVWGIDSEGKTWEHMMALGDINEFPSPIPAHDVLVPLGMSVPLRSVTLKSDYAKVAHLLPTSRAPRSWLLQCMPDTWDIWKCWEDGSDAINRWTVGKHLKELKSGDHFAIWVAGPEAGVYGIGTLASAPYLTREFDPYWTSSPNEATVVNLRFERHLFEDPITKRFLAATATFADSLVMRMPGYGNPIPLPREWRVIADIAKQRSRTKPALPAEPVFGSRPLGQAPNERSTYQLATSGFITYPEAKLLKQYRDYLNRDLRALWVRLPSGELLVCDAFDYQRDLLIEAKGSCSRENVRMAIGQLFDYRRHIKADAKLAILLPDKPSESAGNLIKECGIQLIYRQDATFHESI
ncbi:EVE domain-containing protein [Amycolatopsis xylanica]|uniref:EVE domain-containing protein n=1 Tax=Amycolatopsis xylanica TaxID=589385 RepID=A0A1H3EVU9_9PSEU|nr:EVE domain-containing protein [Amycolatopsis xylanica]SDX82755.1 EVE domain-containing protein [Amycolatopsis xylanica]